MSKNKTVDYEDMINEEYKMYYKNILRQMKKQGFSKVKIAVQKMMYEKREDLFEQFMERYDVSEPIEITFKKE